MLMFAPRRHLKWTIAKELVESSIHYDFYVNGGDDLVSILARAC